MNKKSKLFNIIKFSFTSIFIVAFIIICGNLFDFNLSRNRHLELLGIFIPISTFLIPVINMDKFQSQEIKESYHSKENIIIQIITIIINSIGIIYIWYQEAKASLYPDPLERFGKYIVESLFG